MMRLVIRLYKGKTFCGEFQNAKEIYQYITENEGKEINCLCKLKDLGYKIGNVITK